MTTGVRAADAPLAASTAAAARAARAAARAGRGAGPLAGPAPLAGGRPGRDRRRGRHGRAGGGDLADRLVARPDLVAQRGDAGPVLQALERPDLVGLDQRYDRAARAGPSRAAGAVQVVLVVVRRVVVHDQVDVVDV